MKFDDLPTNDVMDDWEPVLPLRSSGDKWSSYYSGTFSVYDGASVEDVTAERIARVDAWLADSSEGYSATDFTALVELADGTWAACMAWCDTTGWDCRSGVQWKWARTRDDAISQGLDRDARARLGVPLDGEQPLT
jgi:hypothetical protein